MKENKTYCNVLMVLASNIFLEDGSFVSIVCLILNCPFLNVPMTSQRRKANV